MQQLNKIVKASILLIPLILICLYTGISCLDDKYEVTNPNDPRHPDYAKNHPTTTLIVCPTSVPINISASDGTYPDKITITWDTVANGTEYFVYRSTTESGTYTRLFETAITANTYDDTTATGGTNYYYTVSATKTGCTETAKSDSDGGSKATAPSGMVLVPGGTFAMGIIWGFDATNDDEQPVHSVTISSFYMDETEVTTGAFEAYINSESPNIYYLTDSNGTNCNINTSDSSKDNHPVNCVSWEGAKAYCSWKGKRLPTEAEWEYAAGGGSAHWKFSLDQETFTPSKYCYEKDSTCPVKSYGANSFGLYDMSGNVWEWCRDCYYHYFYHKCSNGCTNPICTDNCSIYNVVRGGGWNNPGMLDLYTANRFYLNPGYALKDFGFRCVQN